MKTMIALVLAFATSGAGPAFAIQVHGAGMADSGPLVAGLGKTSRRPSGLSVPANPFGVSLPGNPFGVGLPANPFGLELPANPFGAELPSNPFGVSLPANPYARNDAGSGTGLARV